jgi:hypothetical protein
MDGVTTISVQELEELKAKAAKAETYSEQHKKGLDRLHKHDKEHPEKVNERMRKYLNKNREAYNARRRELRRLKKDAAAIPGEQFNANA